MNEYYYPDMHMYPSMNPYYGQSINYLPYMHFTGAIYPYPFPPHPCPSPTAQGLVEYPMYMNPFSYPEAEENIYEEDTDTGPIHTLHSNIPYFERAFYRDVRGKKKISKSSYIIGLIDRFHFEEYGGKRLNPLSGYEVYYVLKNYDGSPTHETCALLGIPLRYWNELLLTDSNLLQFLRKSPELSHIQDIDRLGIHYINDPLFRFRHAFRQILQEYNPDVLLLFNIEPRGNGRLEKSYPIPLVTIPGGRMEDQDYHSFERCGLREYFEETGINIDNRNIRLAEEKISRKKHKAYVPSSHQEYPRDIRPRDTKMYANFNQNATSEYSNISMFYLVRINQSIVNTPPYHVNTDKIHRQIWSPPRQIQPQTPLQTLSTRPLPSFSTYEKYALTYEPPPGL